MIRIVGYYIRYHMQGEREEPEFADGSCQFGKRIRVLAKHGYGDEKVPRLFDICADGSVVDPIRVEVSPETGMPRKTSC